MKLSVESIEAARAKNNGITIADRMTNILSLKSGEDDAEQEGLFAEAMVAFNQHIIIRFAAEKSAAAFIEAMKDFTDNSCDLAQLGGIKAEGDDINILIFADASVLSIIKCHRGTATVAFDLQEDLGEDGLSTLLLATSEMRAYAKKEVAQSLG